MSGDGGDNAHDNAFGGGKNPGIGNSGSGNNNNSGSSGNSGHGGNNEGMRAPTASEVAGQFNSYGGTQITASQVSNIRGDGDGGYSADIQGQNHTITSGGESHTSNTVGGFSGVPTSGHGNGGSSTGSGGGYEHQVNGAVISPDPAKPGSYISSEPGKTMLASSIDDDSANGVNTYTLHTGKNQTIKVTVPNGDVEQMNVEYNNWKGPKLNHKNMKKFITGFMEFRKSEDEQNGKDALLKASEIISDMGDKIGEHLGDKYKATAKELAENIKNFQGKAFRTYDQAMASLNKVLTNPAIKVYQADKDGLVNAWKSLNAGDTANKLGNLSRAFKVADLALKVEKVREKSIHGYDTGDWGPLMLEVESWVVGGIAARVALGLFSAILGSFMITLGAPVIAVELSGIIVAASIAAWISDDKVLDRLNNEVIRPAQ